MTSGTAVCDLRLAVSTQRKGKDGEKKEDVLFVDCTAWGRTAEVCAEFLAKGKSILLHGRLKFQEWEKDGQKRSKHSVDIDSVQFLSGGEPKEEQGGGSAAAERGASGRSRGGKPQEDVPEEGSPF